MFRISKSVPELEAAADVVSAAFRGIPKNNLIEATAAHLQGDVYSFMRGETLVGFATYKTTQSLLYLAGVAVVPSAQGSRLGLRSMHRAYSDMPKPYLALVTQNPCMAKALFNMGQEVSMDLIPTNIREELSQVSGVPSSSSPLHRHRYPDSGLYGIAGAPRVAEKAINQRFDQLSMDSGLLLTVRIS